MTVDVAYGIVVAGALCLVAGACLIWLRQNDQDMTRLIREIRVLAPVLDDLADSVDRLTAANEKLARRFEDHQIAAIDITPPTEDEGSES